MLTPLDRYLLPPESRIPELEDEDRERILLEILFASFRRNAAAHVPEESVKRWLRTEILDHGEAFEALAAYHREAIEEAWVEEHDHSKGDC